MQALQQKTHRAADEGSVHFNSQLWTFCASIRRNSPVGKYRKKTERKKEKKTGLWGKKNKGVVSSDKLLNLGQPSQREIHALISGT